MLETLTQNSSLLQAGLLSSISLLLGIIAYFVKKTYDKADALDQKFLNSKQEDLDLREDLNSHKTSTTEALMVAKTEFSDAMEKVRGVAFEIRDDVLKCMNAVESNQETLKAHSKALEKAGEIYQNHNNRISQVERITANLLIVKEPKKPKTSR